MVALINNTFGNLYQLHKALPNWDQLRAEKRKRQRALQEKEESNQRKRARLQEQVVVLEDYDDDEDAEKPIEKEKPGDLTDLEYSIFQKLSSVDAVAELVVASMVHCIFYCSMEYLLADLISSTDIY